VTAAIVTQISGDRPTGLPTGPPPPRLTIHVAPAAPSSSDVMAIAAEAISRSPSAHRRRFLTIRSAPARHRKLRQISGDDRCSVFLNWKTRGARKSLRGSHPSRRLQRRLQRQQDQREHTARNTASANSGCTPYSCTLNPDRRSGAPLPGPTCFRADRARLLQPSALTR